MKRLAIASFAISLVPLLALPANAGELCSVSDTVARRLIGPIYPGDYEDVEDATRKACAIAP